MSGQDIGLTEEVGSKNVSETQKDLSEAKGYGSILTLLKEQFNDLIWRDFGYKDIEFDWVAEDSTDTKTSGEIYDTALKNGTLTINEVRQKLGEEPYDKTFDMPMVLTGTGYVPMIAPTQEQEGESDESEGEKPENVEKMQKAMYTSNNYKTWADDRGVSQPFIYMDILSGTGTVIKPPIAVNLESQRLEVETTAELNAMGLNVAPVSMMTLVQIKQMLMTTPDVYAEFEKYIAMTPEYDSEKWRSKYGGSRQFSYYLVSQYIDGFVFSNPLQIADMKRDPDSYKDAVVDLANLWKVEKDMLLGDRRQDQYIITHDKRAYGIDYQFKGDKGRWEKNKTVIQDTLAAIPELEELFKKEIKKEKLTLKGIIKRAKSIYNKVI